MSRWLWLASVFVFACDGARACFGVGWRAELYVGDALPLDVRGVAASAGGVEELWINVVKSTDGDLDYDAADNDSWTTLTLDAHDSQFIYDRQFGTVEGGGAAQARLLTAIDHVSSETLARVTGRSVSVGDVFLFKIGMQTINYGDIGTRATPGDYMGAAGTGDGTNGTVRAEMIRVVRIAGIRPRQPGGR